MKNIMVSTKNMCAYQFQQILTKLEQVSLAKRVFPIFSKNTGFSEFNRTYLENWLR